LFKKPTPFFYRSTVDPVKEENEKAEIKTIKEDFKQL